MFAYMIEKRLAGWQPFLYEKIFYQAIDNNSQLGYIIFRLSLRHLFQAWRRRTDVKALLKYNTQQERQFVLLMRIVFLVRWGLWYNMNQESLLTNKRKKATGLCVYWSCSLYDFMGLIRSAHQRSSIWQIFL